MKYITNSSRLNPHYVKITIGLSSYNFTSCCGEIMPNLLQLNRFKRRHTARHHVAGSSNSQVHSRLTLACSKTLPDVEEANRHCASTWSTARWLPPPWEGWHATMTCIVLAYIIHYNMHMWLRELQRAVIINCASFGRFNLSLLGVRKLLSS